jgi:hypothetical protein
MFNSIKQAIDYYHLNDGTGIGRCCIGKLKSSGKLPDGTPLKWMYYNDYIKLHPEFETKVS